MSTQDKTSQWCQRRVILLENKRLFSMYFQGQIIRPFQYLLEPLASKCYFNKYVFQKIDRLLFGESCDVSIMYVLPFTITFPIHTPVKCLQYLKIFEGDSWQFHTEYCHYFKSKHLGTSSQMKWTFLKSWVLGFVPWFITAKYHASPLLPSCSWFKGISTC